MKTNHTFTFGGLLAVIAVVSTLATIAFPHVCQANGTTNDPSTAAQSAPYDTDATQDDSR